GLRTQLQKWLGRRPQRDRFPQWLNPGFAARLNLHERWREDLGEADPLHPLHPEAYEHLRSAYWVAMFEGYDPGATRCPVEFRHPFFDLRLVDFVLAIPPV